MTFVLLNVILSLNVIYFKKITKHRLQIILIDVECWWEMKPEYSEETHLSDHIFVLTNLGTLNINWQTLNDY